MFTVSDVEDRNQIRHELIELLNEIVDALEAKKIVDLTDEDIRHYQARAARIQESSEKYANRSLTYFPRPCPNK